MGNIENIRENTYTIIKSIVKEHDYDNLISEITDDTLFFEDLGCDSLDMTEIEMEIEDYFGIEFESSVCKKIKTVGDLINFLDKSLR